MNADSNASSPCSGSIRPPTTRSRRLADEPEREKALRRTARSGAQDRSRPRKSALAENQNARRAIEKDVAVHQGRLSKFRDQPMAVKTNRSTRRCSTKSSSRRTEVKTLEEKILERMLEADDLTAAVKRAEADLAARTESVDAERARWPPSTPS